MSEHAPSSLLAQGLTPLSVAELMQAAQQATGLTYWGEDQRFRLGLSVLVDAIEAMTPGAEFRTGAAQRLLQLLSIRLHLVEDQLRHPEILAGKIERPLVIIGLPRTGTTILYDLLALDPQSRSPCEWETFIPWPAPEKESFDSDPRIELINSTYYATILERSPEFATIQRLDARQPGECNHIMTHHFASPNFSAEWSLPEYDRWFLQGPVPGLYATHKRILQQLQWKGPRGNWLLKSPCHLFDLDGLLQTYPDADLVWTHRDPVSTFSSLSSMLRLLMHAQGVEVPKPAVGAAVSAMWTLGLERGTEARNKPGIERAILDMPHREVVADPLAAVRKIYERFNRAFSAEHGERIQRFMTENPAATRIGKHKHSPEEYGLDAAALRRQLAGYYERFGGLCQKAG